MIPKDRKYTKEHEWMKIDGDVGEIGITTHAQEQLGDVVFVELPEAGTKVDKGATFGTVESVKAVSDLFAPVSGEVVEVNDQLPDQPELVNSDPYNQAWMVKIKISDSSELDELLDGEQYEQFLQQ